MLLGGVVHRRAPALLPLQRDLRVVVQEHARLRRRRLDPAPVLDRVRLLRRVRRRPVEVLLAPDRPVQRHEAPRLGRIWNPVFVLPQVARLHARREIELPPRGPSWRRTRARRLVRARVVGLRRRATEHRQRDEAREPRDRVTREAAHCALRTRPARPRRARRAVRRWRRRCATASASSCVGVGVSCVGVVVGGGVVRGGCVQGLLSLPYTLAGRGRLPSYGRSKRDDNGRGGAAALDGLPLSW